jgi:hypothetical protein
MSAMKVSEKAIRVLTEVLKNGFQKCFQKLYEHWEKYVTTQENYFELMEATLYTHTHTHILLSSAQLHRVYSYTSGVYCLSAVSET